MRRARFVDAPAAHQDAGHVVVQAQRARGYTNTRAARSRRRCDGGAATPAAASSTAAATTAAAATAHNATAAATANAATDRARAAGPRNANGRHHRRRIPH